MKSAGLLEARDDTAATRSPAATAFPTAIFMVTRVTRRVVVAVLMVGRVEVMVVAVLVAIGSVESIVTIVNDI